MTLQFNLLYDIYQDFSIKEYVIPVQSKLTHMISNIRLLQASFINPLAA